MKNIYSKTLLATALALSALSASATTTPVVFDFANLKFSSGLSTGFLPTNGVLCSGGDLCSQNYTTGMGATGSALTFASGSISVDAYGFYRGGIASVVQDHENGFNNATQRGAGLGVYHKTGDNADDNITAHETLKLSFSQAVSLTSIGLRSDGHNTSWTSGALFQYSYDGANWTTTALQGSVSPLNATNVTSLYLRYSLATPADQFYLSSVTASVMAVPEPESYALLLAGLGLLGAVAKRRKAAAK